MSSKARELANLGNAYSDGALSNRNRVINGAMVIDQRNGGSSVTPTDGQYVIDRWKHLQSVASKYSVQQNAGSVTPPDGFTNYLGVTSLSAYSVASGDYFACLHEIEGYNAASLSWGTAFAKTITISFWVRSSLTGVFGGAVGNETNTRGYAFTYTISSPNTWEQKSITISGDTSGTWPKTNGYGLRLKFGLGVGATYSATSGSWQSANVVSATGATSVVGTSGATWQITGVQLEVGDTATPFEHRSYGQELALCQRYYQRTQGFQGHGHSASGVVGLVHLHCPMRAAPSFSQNGVFQITDGYTSDYSQSATGGTIYSANANVNNTAYFLYLSNISGLTPAKPYHARMNNQNDLILDAEL